MSKFRHDHENPIGSPFCRSVQSPHLVTDFGENRAENRGHVEMGRARRKWEPGGQRV